jgi:uncharacterized protein (TIGR02266 family)
MAGPDDSTPDEEAAGTDSGRAADKRRHERQAVTLLVEYEGADDFVGDYTENLSSGGTFVHTSRVLELDTNVRLVLSFPGLLEPIALEGVVRWSRAVAGPGVPPGSPDDEPGVGVEFLAGPGRDKLATIVERIRQRDPKTVSRVVKVLVVEDNPHVSELIRDGLRGSSRRSFGEELAFTFATAENGADALELLKSDAFDAVIIDVYLPVMDGAQVINQARHELGLTDLPIIAVSAGGDSARSSALAAGANIFLDKPMRLRQVIDTMRQLVKLTG